MQEEILDEKPVEVVKKPLTWKAGFVSGLLAATVGIVGTEQGVIEPAQQAKIEAVADSIAMYDSTVDYKCDSVNAANVSPARYAAVRPSQDGQQLTDKFNPLYYHDTDEFVIVKTYRGKQGSKDTVLVDEKLIEADKRWLLIVKAAAVMENPPIAVSVDAGIAEEK